MVAMVSGEEASTTEVNSVAKRVNNWIKTLPAQHMHIQPLRLALDSVLKGRQTREALKEALDQRHSVERRLDRLEEDLRTSQLVEESLLTQNAETKQELDTLQLKYDHMMHEDASSTRSRSSGGSIVETRSSKSDESKSGQGKKRVSADGAYSIIPGAPHAERVLPPSQRKQPNSAVASSSGEHRRKDKGKRPEGPASAPPLGLGLFTDADAEPNDGLRVEDVALRVGHESGEASNMPWNGMGNALGMQMDAPQVGGHRGNQRSEEWSRSHNHTGSTGGAPRSAPMTRNASSDSSLANLSILSPLDSSGIAGQRNHNGIGALLHGSQSTIDISTPQSATTWGTTTISSHSSRSSFSVGDMELNGLPPLPSRSSLNLGITGLDDFETGEDDSDDEMEDEVMTPGAGRHVNLVRDSGLAIPFTRRFTEAPEVLDRRPSQSRHISVPDRSRAGMTPRVISRSVSDITHPIPTSSRLTESDSEEEELEVVAMRFSQSYSEVEPALSGFGSNSGSSTSFDDPTSAERVQRRRASTIAGLDLAPLDMNTIDLGQENGGGPSSAHAQLYGRSVAFSTPKPGLDTSRSQPAALPQASSRSHGLVPSLYASLVQIGHGKRPQTPKTVPATPFVSTTRVVASSSAANSASHPMHRGAATVSAPLRPLPPASYDPMYTSIMPSNGHSLPPSHYPTPYVAPRTFQPNGSANNGANPGAQQASYTLQPVSTTGPSESSTQPRSTTNSAQAPVLHAPQPVSGKSHIGRPWRDWER